MMRFHLKCDATGCDHRESHPEPSDDLVGRPCPKCGANLLTQADYDEVMQHTWPALVLLEKLGVVREPESGEKADLSINYHDGELRVRLSNTRPA